MEHAWVLLFAWILIAGVVFAPLARERLPRCPACGRRGREIVEDARLHTGWQREGALPLPFYVTRHQFRCRRCGHRWSTEH